MARCAFITHQMAKTSEGGAENQIYKTMEMVRRFQPNHEVRLFNPWTDSINDFDIIHIFAPSNFPLESHRISEYARGHGIKVVTTPIFYHDENFGEGWTAYSRILDRLLTDFRKLFTIRPLDRLNPYLLLHQTLKNSDLVLPNSHREMEEIIRYFGIENERFRIIPNGVDLRFERGDASLFEQKFGFSDFVLFVGRIQPVKNVAMLMEGFNRSGIGTDLVIIGKPVDQAYYERCKALSNGRIHFLPALPHGSDMLSSAYRAAKVVALPSFHETVGLVALEGGLAGANIVVTNVGGAREYLGDDAWYVDPRSGSSIASALREAYSSERRTSLKERIRSRYNWEEAGRLTLEAYDRVMGKAAKRS